MLALSRMAVFLRSFVAEAKGEDRSCQGEHRTTRNADENRSPPGEHSRSARRQATSSGQFREMGTGENAARVPEDPNRHCTDVLRGQTYLDIKHSLRWDRQMALEKRRVSQVARPQHRGQRDLVAEWNSWGW